MAIFVSVGKASRSVWRFSCLWAKPVGQRGDGSCLWAKPVGQRGDGSCLWAKPVGQYGDFRVCGQSQ